MFKFDNILFSEYLKTNVISCVTAVPQPMDGLQQSGTFTLDYTVVRSSAHFKGGASNTPSNLTPEIVSYVSY